VGDVSQAAACKTNGHRAVIVWLFETGSASLSYFVAGGLSGTLSVEPFAGGRKFIVVLRTIWVNTKLSGQMRRSASGGCR
jgi:hypothetical protein